MPKLSKARSVAKPDDTRQPRHESLLEGRRAFPAAAVIPKQHGTDGFVKAVEAAESAYHKRVHDYGPRLFCHSDGSLKAERPENNHYSVATRKSWAAVINHCRRTGGENEVEKSGHSFRFNIGVEHEEHAAFLKALRMEPEHDKDGQWHGLDASKTGNPLDDAEHILNVLKHEMHARYEW